MRKIIILLLVLSIISSLFGGCSNKNDAFSISEWDLQMIGYFNDWDKNVPTGNYIVGFIDVEFGSVLSELRGENMKTAIKLLLNTWSVLAYSSLCIYSILFSSFCSIGSLQHYIFQNCPVLKDLLSLTEFTAFIYIFLVLLGLVGCLILIILYRHQKSVWTFLMFSVAPNIIMLKLATSTFSSLACCNNYKYLFWLLILWFTVTLIFLIRLYVRYIRSM